MDVPLEASKIGSCARKAKRGLRNRLAKGEVSGRAVVVLLASVVVLGLAAIWFLGASSYSTGRGDSELAPRPRSESAGDSSGLAAAADNPGAPSWGISTPLVAGEFQTYVLTPSLSAPTRRGTRHILVRPSDEPGAHFEIESVRLIFRKEHMEGLASGPGWHGLAEIYQETLLARSGEELHYSARLPERARLELELGTLEEGPVTFSAAMAIVDRAEKTVKFVPIDPMSAVRTFTLSANGMLVEVAICHTRPRFGNQVARMNTASPVATASTMYLRSAKTCLRPTATIADHSSLRATSMIDLRAA